MSSDTRSRSTAARLTGTGIGLVVGLLLAMWLVEAVDAIFLSDRLEAQGIQPRTWGGLDGVLWAPFLHGDFGHLMSNTVPFAILGGLVAVSGRRHFVVASIFVTVVGGLATWALARSGNHIGASGLVFGFLGYLVAAAVIQRRLRALLIGGLAAILYGGLIFGLIPRAGISWEGHFFGLAAGIAAAVATGRPAPAG